MLDEGHTNNLELGELGRRVTRHPATRSRTVGDDTFVVHLQNDFKYHLDTIGTAMWQLFDGYRTLEDIAQAIAQRFNADLPRVETDVVNFTRVLSRKSLVLLEGGAPIALARSAPNSNTAAQVEQLYGIAERKSIPLTAVLMLTHACNMKCYYCYDDGQRSRVLTYEQWCRILDELAQAGTLFVRLTGGEPTLHPDFIRIAEYAAQKGFAISVMTNGTFLTPALAERLGALDLELVAIAFHGGTPQVHDRLGGLNGAFERTRRGIELLLAQNIRVSTAMAVTRQNFHEMDDFLHCAEMWGVTRRGLSISVAARTNGATDTLDQRLAPEQIQEMMRRGLYKPSANMYCGAAMTKCAITPDGHVTPCHLFLTEVGDLKQTSFAEIWNHAPALLQMRRERWFAPPEECQVCPAYRKYCNRCPAQVYYELGSLRNKSSFDCQVVDLYLELQKAGDVCA